MTIAARSNFKSTDCDPGRFFRSIKVVDNPIIVPKQLTGVTEGSSTAGLVNVRAPLDFGLLSRFRNLLCRVNTCWLSVFATSRTRESQAQMQRSQNRLLRLEKWTNVNLAHKATIAYVNAVALRSETLAANPVDESIPNGAVLAVLATSVEEKTGQSHGAWCTQSTKCPVNVEDQPITGGAAPIWVNLHWVPVFCSAPNNRFEQLPDKLVPTGDHYPR